MAQTISISMQQNNTLGTCFLLKWEDDFTGELLDKCLYPISDYTAVDAMQIFLSEHVGPYEEYIDGIYLLDGIRESDKEAHQFALMYKSRYGIEYRSMLTAVHHIIVFDRKEDAEMFSERLEAEGENDALMAQIEKLSSEDLEIHYNDVEDVLLPAEGYTCRYYDDDRYGIYLVNDFAYDLYI